MPRCVLLRPAARESQRNKVSVSSRSFLRDFEPFPRFRETKNACIRRCGMREVAVKASKVLNYESRKEVLGDDSVDLRNVASI